MVTVTRWSEMATEFMKAVVFCSDGALLPSILMDNCSCGKEVNKEWK